MSFAEAAEAINARFGTAYSRNATIGRAKRMGLAALDRPEACRGRRNSRNRPALASSRTAAELRSRRRRFPNGRERIKLRCVQIVPRHLALIELEAGDCRYPYGGDAEAKPSLSAVIRSARVRAIALGHFNLTRGPGTASERAAVPVGPAAGGAA